MRVSRLVVFVITWVTGIHTTTLEKSVHDEQIFNMVNIEDDSEYFDGKLSDIDGDFVGATEYNADAFPRGESKGLSDVIDANEAPNAIDKIKKLFHNLYGMILKSPPLMTRERLPAGTA